MPGHRHSRTDFFFEASFRARGLCTGPMCVDWAAHPVLSRSRWLLSGLGVVVVGLQVWLGQAAASSISRGILLGSIFYGLRVGLWTRVRPSRRSSCASKKALVTFETCAGGRGLAGLGWARPLPHQCRGGFFLEASFMAWELGTGPVCVDSAAPRVLPRSRSLL